MIVERFAPSPTGLLHIGHAFSAYTAWQAARVAGGKFLIRLEDLDTSRAKPQFVDAIYKDLRWLGIEWNGQTLAQSTRTDAYLAAFDELRTRGLTYRCTCTRRDIADAIAAPQEGARLGPDGPVYPGTCRDLDHGIDQPHAIRLDVARAIETLRGPAAVSRLYFDEIGAGPDGQTGRIPLDPAALIAEVGDFVLCRRDGAAAYHLAVVIDDAYQDVSHVTRGNDLFASTQVHRILQALLGLPTPICRHHRLIRDESGRRLAKRDDARAIATYRQMGLSPVEVLEKAGISAPTRMAD